MRRHCPDSIGWTCVPALILSTENEFIWTANHNAADAAMKQAQITPPALAYYDPSCPTCPHADASRRQGLGFVLTQKKPDNTWCTRQAGSQFLSNAESSFANDWAGNTWRCLGSEEVFSVPCRSSTLRCDHWPQAPHTHPEQPLIGWDREFSPSTLAHKLMPYNFTATWLKGSEKAAADAYALSRAPVTHADDKDILHKEVAICTSALANFKFKNGNQRLHVLRHSAPDDPRYQSLLSFVANRFSEHKRDLPEVTLQCTREIYQRWYSSAGMSVTTEQWMME